MTGEELRILRKKYKYTQTELAKEVGTKQSRITEWETGVQEMGSITKKMFTLFFENIELKKQLQG